MNNKKILWLSGLGIIVIIVIGIFAFSKNPSPLSQPTTQANQITTTSAQGTSATSYTLADISSHNSASSCWMAIEGKVYDVTSYIPRHPGGDAILQGCGKDATAMFNQRPGSGTPHSNRARQMLVKYYIGDLK
jgi:cytochrome b involved in lipid metabolism